jgi:prepilin-type N-terminal cleavage/methylation domain-containing protein
MSRRARTISGFTLIELVLVLTIIAVAVMMMAPMLGSFVRGRGPTNTAGQFVSLAHWARSQAVADGTAYHLNIDTTAGTWWLTKDNGQSFASVDAAYYGKVFSVPDDVRIQTDAPKLDKAQVIAFDPSGRSDPAVVKFIGTRGNGESDAVCETAIDPFHVVDGGKQ